MAWLPLYLLAGFLGIGWIVFGDRIVPGRPVEVTAVVTRNADSDSPSEDRPAAATVRPPADPFSGEVLFQASGWVEPSPFPIRATTLRDGVLEEVFVLEGARVEEGQLLATLDNDLEEIALNEAEVRLAESKAALLREEAEVEGIDAQLATHALRVAALEAELEILRDEEKRFTTAGKDTFPEREIRQAQLRLAAGVARLAALEGRGVELRAQRRTARAVVEIARHRMEAATVAVERAELDLDRTAIRSPVDGIVQRLFAEPGRKRMLGMDDPESATIAKIYQPRSLQARIDVPLEEAARLFIDQPVVVRSNFLPEREFRGFVTRIEGMADIQRNTLQAKVSLQDPDPRLRPEMLCRAEFLSRGGDDRGASPGRGSAGGRVRIYAPQAAITGRDQNKAFVWSLDANLEKARRREVRLGDRDGGGFIEILEGLNPGDPVLLNPPGDLRPGDRVQPIQPESRK